MPISFCCPSCQKELKAPEGTSGMNITCPKCKQPLTVPWPSPTEIEEEPFLATEVEEEPIMAIEVEEIRRKRSPEIRSREKVSRPNARNANTSNEIIKLAIIVSAISFLVLVLVAVAVHTIPTKLATAEKPARPLSPAEFHQFIRGKELLGRSYNEVRNILGSPEEIQAHDTVTWVYNQRTDHCVMIVFQNGICTHILD